MIKIESVGTSAFLVNGIPFQKGSVGVDRSLNLIGLYEVGHDTRYIVAVQHFSNYVDDLNNPFATVNDLLTYLGQAIMQ